MTLPRHCLPIRRLLLVVLAALFLVVTYWALVPAHWQRPWAAALVWLPFLACLAPLHATRPRGHTLAALALLPYLLHGATAALDTPALRGLAVAEALLALLAILTAFHLQRCQRQAAR